MLGGALGNLIDRIHQGHVTDFIDVGPWPVFNLADSAIVVGLVMMGWLLVMQRDQSNAAETARRRHAGQRDLSALRRPDDLAAQRGEVRRLRCARADFGPSASGFTGLEDFRGLGTGDRYEFIVGRHIPQSVPPGRLAGSDNRNCRPRPACRAVACKSLAVDGMRNRQRRRRPVPLSTAYGPGDVDNHKCPSVPPVPTDGRLGPSGHSGCRRGL